MWTDIPVNCKFQNRITLLRNFCTVEIFWKCLEKISLCVLICHTYCYTQNWHGAPFRLKTALHNWFLIEFLNTNTFTPLLKSYINPCNTTFKICS